MEAFREVISGCILQHSPLPGRVALVTRRPFSTGSAGEVSLCQGGASVYAPHRRTRRASARRMDPVCSSSDTASAQASTGIRFK